MKSKTSHKCQEFFFDLIIYASYFLIVISFFDLSENAPKYLSKIDYYFRIYICIFLMWRFNPFRTQYEFTDLDRKITFSAGAFILTTTALNEYVDIIKVNIKKIIKSVIAI